jgi:Fe-S cluster biogenesis protein NfuA
VLEKVDGLLHKLESCPDPAMREAARDLVRELLDFHRAGLQEVMGLADETLRGRLAGDPKIEPLLLLHGLHPEALETRVERALAKVRPYLASHGGSVEFLGVVGARIRLRLQGSCDGCPSSAETLKGAIEAALLESAPDAEGIEVV